MFSLRADGVTVRPIRQLGGGTGFAEIFLDEVFVPDADVIGEPGDGWRIAMSTAGHERGLSLRSPGRFTAAADRLVGLWRRTTGPAGTPGTAGTAGLAGAAGLAGTIGAAGTATADRVADAWIAARAYRLHTYATAARLAAGGTLGAEASLGKVFWSELDVALHETALDLLGPQAEVAGSDGPDGRWLDGYLFALAGPIYAGTNEIQRTVIAERLLGLPGEVVPMSLAGSAEQEQFAAAVHELAVGHGRDRGRAALGGPGSRGLSLAVWRRLAGTGATALAVPGSMAASAPAWPT
jgi:alkylation response protein AidB-like acyl-CoA dehydrogenase